MISQVGPSQVIKERALAEVLASQLFARSEQLKSFLRYVCELEIAGRAAEIKEYSIGTMALGRSGSYNPAADSTVRRRAFELRAKLEEIYQTELAETVVRIEIPKGSYVPIFYRKEDLVEALPPPPALVLAIDAPTKIVPTTVERPSVNLWRSFVAALVCGLLLGALGMRFYAASASSQSNLTVVREAWGPLGTPQGNVLISIASSLQMAVRPGGFSPDSDLPSFPAPPEIYALYQKSSPLAGEKLFMRPVLNSVSLGVLGAVASAATNLRVLGAQYQILPERIAPLASFRNRNVILIGDPLNSFAAAKLFSRARLTIAQDLATNRLVIRDLRRPPTDPPAFSRFEGLSGKPAEFYGLLTMLPSDSTEPGQDRRTLIVSGVSNVGIQGAMEFFASEEHLIELKRQLQKEGLVSFPKAYQVVVRCTAENGLPLTCGYAAHYILRP